MDDLSETLSMLVQLPIVAVFAWITWKFIGEMRIDRQQFIDALDRERESREAAADKLDTTLTGLTTSVRDLHHAVRGQAPP